MDKKEYFMQIFKAAEKKYGKHEIRLAAEGWDEDWKILIATIMSAQSRDETTIPIAEELFRKYPSVRELSMAQYEEVLQVLRSLNYNRTKAKNVMACAKMLDEKYNGEVPEDMEKLLELPGVGRKTANLVIYEIHRKEGICVDTHVHRISNVLGFVKTKTPHQTELELQKLAPKKYWGRINRCFVVWGKHVRGKDKKKILEELNKENKG